MRQDRQSAQKGPCVVVALDSPNLEKALGLVDELRGLRCWYKIGCQLFARHGRRAVDELVKRGRDVFVDLKVNGHPATDDALGREIATWGVRLVDIHLALGRKAILGFLEGLGSRETRPKVLGVTVLTSHADVSTLGLREDRHETVLRLAGFAKKVGLDGVVAAAADVPYIKKRYEDFLVVTPGIRPSGSPAHEQRHVATPFGATKAGADFLVIGRPITQAANPREALEAILDEVAAASRGPAACEHGDTTWPLAATSA